LVTDDFNGQNRSALAAVRSLGQAGYHVTVSTNDWRSVAAVSKWCTDATRLPSADSVTYDKALRDLVSDSDFSAVLPASDLSVRALRLPAAPLVDKVTLAERARASGLRTVPDTVYQSTWALKNAIKELSLPVIVKPVQKSGGQQAQALRCDTAAQIRALADHESPVIVQPFMPGGLRAISGVIWGGRFLALCHQRYRRLWPRHAGVGSSAVTVAPDLGIEERLRTLLADHNGVWQVQLAGDYLLDVNPRIYGSMPLAIAAGANLPVIACAAAQGTVDELVRARAGVRYQWLEGDVRSVTQAVCAKELGLWEGLRDAIPRRGDAHSIESLGDPLPMAMRLARAVSRRP
jgi:hypothetical protein